jgi:hypothetical protein
MLRMVDFRCPVCEFTEEICVRKGDPSPLHCGIEMDKVWLKAPGIHYKPHYSHALGRRVERYADEDKALEQKGQWIASKSEANSTYGTDIFDDNVTIKQATKESVRKHVEKAARKLASDGVLRSGKGGWEFTGNEGSAP